MTVTVVVNYSVPGTLYTSTRRIQNFTKETVESEINRIIERNENAREKIGGNGNYTYTTPVKNLDTLEPA